MKYLLACALLGFMIPAAAGAQQQSAPSGQQKQQQQQQQQQQPPPPTLGPEQPAPSPSGPPSASTVNPRRLLRIHTIYIARIDNDLNAKLTEALAKLAWVQIVDQPDKADAVVRGTSFASRRLKELHSEVYINDRTTGASIWQDVVRIHVYPPALSKAVSQTADKVANDLQESLNQAGR